MRRREYTRHKRASVCGFERLQHNVSASVPFQCVSSYFTEVQLIVPLLKTRNDPNHRPGEPGARDVETDGCHDHASFQTGTFPVE